MNSPLRSEPGQPQLAILDAIARDRRVSQRALAERVGISVGLVNSCLQKLIADGHVRVADRRVRPYAYRLTPAGHERRRHLRFEHYQSVLGSYQAVERRIHERLAELRGKGVRRVLFYGAGEVMELAAEAAAELGLEVDAALDDDESKHGTERYGLPVRPPTALHRLNPDAVVITTFRHALPIEQRLQADGGQGRFVWHL